VLHCGCGAAHHISFDADWRFLKAEVPSWEKPDFTARLDGSF
jgi:hypothetical protein